MRLIGRNQLTNIKGVTNDIDKWVSVWAAEIDCKNWFNELELLKDYPNLIMLEDSFYLFPIFTSGYSIKALISFKRGTILLIEINSEIN